MHRWVAHIVLAAVFLAGGRFATAQDAPRPEELVRSWLDAQVAQRDRLARVEFVEEAEWTIDGPFGERRMQFEARVSGGPATEGWQREFVSVRVNGEAVPPERWRALERRRRALVGPPAERLFHAIMVLPRLMHGVQPVGATTAETIGDVATWRVDAVSRARPHPVERVTLWFSQTDGHLRRSRILARMRREAPPLIVTTDHDHLDGVDVPRRRHIEGTGRMERRMRTFTVLFSYEATYRDVRLFFDEGG